MEGSKSNVLITADCKTIKVWDIDNQTLTKAIKVEEII